MTVARESLSSPSQAGRRFEAVLVVMPPLLLVVGWLILILNAGQGANDAWFLGHYVLFLANAGWVPATLVLARVAGRGGTPVTDPTLWLVLLGSLAIAGQLAIDLAAWALGLDANELRAFFEELRLRPFLSLTLHTVGPGLLFVGLFVAAWRVSRAKPAVRLGAVLVGGGIAVVFIGALTTYSLVILGGYVAVLLGFGLMAWLLQNR